MPILSNFPGNDRASEIAALRAQLNEAIKRIAYAAQASRTGTAWALTVSNPPSSGAYTMQFIAPSAYVEGDTVTVNGVAYTIKGVNGDELSDSAWAEGAVVQLSINADSKTAYFGGGGGTYVPLFG